MEIVRTYPILLILTVLLPIFAGFATAYIGWNNLEERLRVISEGVVQVIDDFGNPLISVDLSAL